MSDQRTQSKTAPQIEIQPLQALVDEAVIIILTGMAAEKQVTICAQVVDPFGYTFKSHATFLTDTQGSVDLSTQRPLSGTYDQLDPMGLFWSMALAAGSEFQSPPSASVPPLAPLSVQFEATVAGTVVASTESERRFLSPEVKRTEVRQDKLVATLFCPPGVGPYPAVIVLGGSDGGLREAPAALLASHGFVTLALAYFGIDPLPPGLVEIPLEYFGSAIRWLMMQKEVDPHALAVMGWSRGGELALLLGVSFPEIRAVVAYVPSGVMWSGVSAPGSSRAEQSASWTFGGMPLPFMRFPVGVIDWSRPPIALTPGFLAALQDAAAVEQATIPVEQTRGSILLISGTDDQMWPSTQLAQIAIRRLAQHHFAFPVEHLSYPGAGHLILPPYGPTTVRHLRHPVTGWDYRFGGTAPADAFARADSWPKVLQFLRNSLEP